MSIEVHCVRAGMANAYLIASETGLILVDAGSPGQEGVILAQMQSLKRSDLRLIFITHAHYDHYGSAAAIRRVTGAPVAIHPADAAAIALGKTHLGYVRGWGRLVRIILPLAEYISRVEPLMANLLLQEGADLGEFGLPARVLHTPGHTPGSCTLLVDGQLAFAGDLISTTGSPHIQRYFADDWVQVEQSVLRLIQVSPHFVYPGHGRHPLPADQLHRLNASI
jgi:glyoxylase-like metal-dependent hydrolase (beta-lactamase superfamily II)